METQKPMRLWSLAAVMVVGGALVSIDSGPVQGVVRACCFANGNCEDLSRSICEDQQGGMSHNGTELCNMVVCPVLCGGSSPECDGECPDGNVCIQDLAPPPPPPAQAGETTCECVPEIPQGGGCEQEPQACAGRLPCVDGVCCATLCLLGQRCDVPGSEGVCVSVTTLAPAASSTVLVALIALLVAAGTWTLTRHRRTR
jgi:hypothetical protein